MAEIGRLDFVAVRLRLHQDCGHLRDAAGHDPGVPAARDERGYRLIHGRRGDIVKLGCWHGRHLLVLDWGFMR